MTLVLIQHESPNVLLDKITKIIALIPNPIWHEYATNWEGAAVHKLTEVQNKIKSSPITPMDGYWNEVGEILNFNIFTQKGPWVNEILKIFSEEF